MTERIYFNGISFNQNTSTLIFQKIIDILCKNPNGLSAKEISQTLKISQAWVMRHLQAAEVHIDRYEKRSKNGRLASIWVIGKEQNCPYPNLSKETLRRKK